MFRKFLCLLTAALCLAGVVIPALGAEVDSDSVYCFSAQDFSQEEALEGICILQLPDAASGTVLLGSRVLRPGDILTQEQIAQMTFAPLRTETDQTASVTYLPIYEDYVAQNATMTISIRGKEDKAPVAEDMALETYKNLPNTAKLKVTDPEGQTMTYSVIRQPKRGEVTIAEDGSFTYTPKKNKVGVDSFTFTATDPAGNVSREATVTIQILKPTDAQQYQDTLGHDCRFAAEWMRNTGLFIGEKVGDADCFYPEKTVNRGEFLTMLIKSLNIPVEETETAASQGAPEWFQPYLTAALRAGLTAGLPQESMDAMDEAVTGAEAAVMLQNALDLTTAAELEEEVPAWAQSAMEAMQGSGIALTAEAPLTRGDAAQVLYQANLLSNDAPGMAVFRLAGAEQ
ncbi:MAG TPA: cadherin-like domain-containing protein [Candidatus Faecousia intestinigallinarum]|nr:cadherin-like domain-containing protein [Candidatus Faecousia intestinigallinarum]